MKNERKLNEKLQKAYQELEELRVERDNMKNLTNETINKCSSLIKDKSEFQQVGSGFFRNSVSLIANQDKKLNFSNISEFWKAILFANECNIDNDVITVINYFK